MSNPALKWSPEQIEALRTMACERRLSTSEIAQALAAQFGIARSRSAVIGKMYRLREEETRPPKLPKPPKPPAKHEKYSSEYIAWMSMKARCNNPKQSNWRWYGGRGITVCGRWVGSFEAFLADMGRKPSPRHVFTRINRDDNYTPGNCRWAMPSERQQKPAASFKDYLAASRYANRHSLELVCVGTQEFERWQRVLPADAFEVHTYRSKAGLKTCWMFPQRFRRQAAAKGDRAA